MPQTYSFDVNANVQPAISQINSVNTALQNLGKTPIQVKIDTNGITNQLKNLKANIQLTPQIKGGNGANSLFGRGTTGVNQAIKRWTQAAQITNTQGATKASKQLASAITAGADQTQATYARRVKLFERAIASTNDVKTRNSLQNKFDQFVEGRASDMASNYGKQWQNLSDQFNKSISSVYQRGRSFSDAVDVDGLRKQIDDLGTSLGSEKTWGGNRPQEFANQITQLQSKVKQMSDPSNIMMDTSSMSKYASKLSRALDGQMKRETRKTGQSYLAQIEDAMSGGPGISLSDWNQKNRPGMEKFIQQANRETNGVTGFLKRMGGSLKGQNAALLGNLFSTGSLVQGARQMAQATTRVDDAIVELRKVSNASPQRLAQDKEINARTAQKYGTTLSDAIQSTASWSKLGNSLKDAQKLTQISAQFMAVGDRMSTSSVQETLTSVQRAWNQTPKQLKRSLDTINEVKCLLPFYCKRI